MAIDTGGRSSGMSRRDLIRNAEIAGAAAWTPPAIIGSIASPAAAGTAHICGDPGSTSYWFQITAGGSCTTAVPITTSGAATCRACTADHGVDIALPCCIDSSKVATGTDLASLIGFSAPLGCGTTTDPVTFSVSANCTFLDARGARSAGCVPRCQAPGAGSNCFSGRTSAVSGTKGGQSWTSSPSSWCAPDFSRVRLRNPSSASSLVRVPLGALR